jgi:hypothetical protein
MGSLSSFLANALLNGLANTTYTAPTTVYVALCTADPTDAGTGASMNEVANTNGYGRTAMTFSAASARKVVQSGAVSFPEASGSWGTITHWALVDTPTYGAGNVLAHGSFSPSFVPVSGNTPTIPTTQTQVEISATAGGAGYSNYLVHKWLDLAFRNQAFAKPATYVGLATTVMDDADVAIGDLTEVTGGSYARVLVNANGGAAPTWEVATGGALANVHDITFVTPSGGWGTVVSAFLIDSASGAGNVLGYDQANVIDQAVVTADTVYFPAGSWDNILS